MEGAAISRDGSGNFTRVAGPYTGGTTILKDNINDEMDDIATALSDSINKAGTKAWAANQPMAGFILTGLGAGSAAGHSVRYEQVFPSVFQPLDATLTALAGLTYASGTPLVAFSAADTVALTLTPSVNTLTATSTVAATHSVTAKNTTDAASVAGLRIEGDRATPAANDQVFASFYMSDSAGNQDEFARITAVVESVTSGNEAGQLRFGQVASGALADRVVMTAATWASLNNDTLALGTAALGWADLFLASGGVINWDNGNYTLTHISGGMEASGTFRARTPLSSETSGTLTAASSNKRVKATAGVTINDGVHTAEDAIEIYNDSDSSITLTQDTGMTLRLAGTTSTGNRTLAARAIAYVYFDTNADAAVGGTGVT